MAELFQQLLQWVNLHPGWSSAVIFLVAMAESLAIIGLVVPGVVIMFGIGALISTGAIAFWPAMGWAVAGAVAGDGFSFWLGVHYRDQLATMWPFSRYPESLDRGIHFFQKYGGKSVAIGRFFGPVRAVIPLVAGVMGMPAGRFLVANIASALVWAPAYLLPGIVFGASLELASAVALRLVSILLLSALIIWLSFILTRASFKLLSPHINQWLHRLLKWSQAHPKAGEIATALIDPQHPEARGLSIWAALLVFAALVFTLLLLQISGGTPLLAADPLTLNLLQHLRSPLADQMMVYITRVADSGVVITLVMGVALSLYFQGHKRTLAYWVAAVLFCLVASPLLKFGLAIPRPDVVISPPSSNAFPSGHTLKAVVLYGFIAVMIGRALPSTWRWLPYSVCGALITSVALSRLYLGVHWLSDILGSLTLGIAWVAILGIAYHRHTQCETQWRTIAAATLLSIMLGYIGETITSHEKRLHDYQPKSPQAIHIEPNQWPQRAAGMLKRPINFQYAGTIEWIIEQLESSGWQTTEQISWKNGLKILSPELPLSDIPALPKLHSGLNESLLLIKPLSNSEQLSIRLWPSYLRLKPDGKEIWSGEVTLEHKRTILGTLSYARSKATSVTLKSRLINDLAPLSYDWISGHHDASLDP